MRRFLKTVGLSLREGVSKIIFDERVFALPPAIDLRMESVPGLWNELAKLTADDVCQAIDPMTE
jgi:hypothetical protein